MEAKNNQPIENLGEGGISPATDKESAVATNHPRANDAPALDFELKPGWLVLPPEELPLPTYWPVVMALAVTLFAMGFLTSQLIIVAAVILFIVSLIGWIGDLQNEQKHGNTH